MSKENLLENLLQVTTENEVVEFKEAKIQFEKNKLGQYFSALSNEANLNHQKFAYLVMGVKDNKSVVGTSINDTQLNDYKNSQTLRRSAQIVNIDKVWKLSKN